MPIKIQKDLPAREILEHENIFVMDEDRAIHQDIRPLKIIILNLMPDKEETELQILRCLSNSPLQVDVFFLMVKSHESRNTSRNHLNKFYLCFDDIRNKRFDGLIITGAPVETLAFTEVDYWNELTEIMDWSDTHVTSVMYQCWAAQAAFYYYYGLEKVMLPEKIFGIFRHRVEHRKVPLVRGFDDEFGAPHSRHADVPPEKIRSCGDLVILAESDEAGVLLAMSRDGRKVFVQGHPEYDRLTLDKEYKRDLAKGMDIRMPANYYPDNDPGKKPLLLWRSESFHLYMNWLNYYVYQTTPYDIG